MQTPTFMAEAMPRERRGKHQCANTVIEVSEDGESARAFTDYIFVSLPDPTDESVGYFHSSCVARTVSFANRQSQGMRRSRSFLLQWHLFEGLQKLQQLHFFFFA